MNTKLKRRILLLILIGIIAFGYIIYEKTQIVKSYDKQEKLYEFDEETKRQELEMMQSIIKDKKEHRIAINKMLEEEKIKKEQEKKLKEQEELKIKKEKEIKKQQSEIQYVGKIIFDGDNISWELKNMLNNQLKLIPKKILNEFYNSNFDIVLTNKSISKNYYHGSIKGSIAGLFSCPDNKIYIETRKNAINKATLHEFGHFLDYLYDSISFSDEFIKIYEEEKNLLNVYSVDGHYKSNNQEFFGEVFKEVIKNPSKTKKEVPKSYNFIMNCINNL